MKNINNYILTAIVSLVLVVATSFLMTAADEPIRQAGYYLPVVFGAVGTWAAGKAGLLKLDYEERTARSNAHAAACDKSNHHLFSLNMHPLLLLLGNTFPWGKAASCISSSDGVQYIQRYSDKRTKEDFYHDTGQCYG